MTDREAFVTRTCLMHSFRDFSLHDLELPDSIASLHDLRVKAVAVFDAVYEGLDEAADRHFAEIAGTRGPLSGGIAPVSLRRRGRPRSSARNGCRQ